MEEMEGMKEAFNIFIDSCEKAGVKFSKEEKQVEEFVDGDTCFLEDVNGDIEDYYWVPGMKNKILFKTKKMGEKYYSIIDTINNIVDELGRSSWGDFDKEYNKIFSIHYDFRISRFITNYFTEYYQQNTFFPYSKKPYLEKLLEKVSENDLLWAFKKSMRLI